jgi:hypothetical protein
VLEAYYVNRLCSPTRTSLMSGRYAYNLGLGDEVIVNGHPEVLRLNESTIANHLCSPKYCNGSCYACSAFGKWDIGMTTAQHTPVGRGFQHFVGYYDADEDYVRVPARAHAQSCCASAAASVDVLELALLLTRLRAAAARVACVQYTHHTGAPFGGSRVGCNLTYLDLHNDTLGPTPDDYRSLQLHPMWDETTYSTIMYTREALRTIDAHDRASTPPPFFICEPFTLPGLPCIPTTCCSHR